MTMLPCACSISFAGARGLLAVLLRLLEHAAAVSQPDRSTSRSSRPQVTAGEDPAAAVAAKVHAAAAEALVTLASITPLDYRERLVPILTSGALLHLLSIKRQWLMLLNTAAGLPNVIFISPGGSRGGLGQDHICASQ